MSNQRFTIDAAQQILDAAADQEIQRLVDGPMISVQELQQMASESGISDDALMSVLARWQDDENDALASRLSGSAISKPPALTGQPIVTGPFLSRWMVFLILYVMSTPLIHHILVSIHIENGDVIMLLLLAPLLFALAGRGVVEAQRGDQGW